MSIGDKRGLQCSALWIEHAVEYTDIYVIDPLLEVVSTSIATCELVD